MLCETSLDRNVSAGWILPILESGGTAGPAQIRITFSHSHETGAPLIVTLSIAATSWESVRAIRCTMAELLAEILSLNTGAVWVLHRARSARVVAGSVVIHVVVRILPLHLYLSAMMRPESPLSIFALVFGRRSRRGVN